MATKRIYIGGLTADISQSDVAGRFTPFGEVLSVEVIKAKAVGADPDSCRGFAYVTLSPKDDASMARMLSLVSAAECLAFVATAAATAGGVLQLAAAAVAGSSSTRLRLQATFIYNEGRQ
jgi:hypothetical protein